VTTVTVWLLGPVKRISDLVGGLAAGAGFHLQKLFESHLLKIFLQML